MKLEKSIKELHDMFMDMAMLVESQVSENECKNPGLDMRTLHANRFQQTMDVTFTR
jgi:t-SNARE complex subunit (syntaxin)